MYLPALCICFEIIKHSDSRRKEEEGRCHAETDWWGGGRQGCKSGGSPSASSELMRCHVTMELMIRAGDDEAVRRRCSESRRGASANALPKTEEAISRILTHHSSSPQQNLEARQWNLSGICLHAQGFRECKGRCNSQIKPELLLFCVHPRCLKWKSFNHHVWSH